MKLLICSDTHGDGALLTQLLRLEAPDALLHLGDCYADTLEPRALFPHIPFHCVAGNNDYTGEAPDELQLALGGKCLFLTHGHHYRVKRGLTALALRGEELGVDAVLFGHTHQSSLDCRHNIWFLNPGSASRLLYQPRGTYATMLLHDGTIRCDLHTLP